MSEPGSRRGRTHDAEGARQTILDAAEEVFAEHGFDGARIDAIAEVAGYNKSLIFQYFDDKLGLYSAVIRRADDQTRVWQNEALSSFLAAEASITNDQIRDLLRKYVGLYFDYLVEHPRILRIYMWEMAEGWQTFSRIVSQRDFDDVDQFEPVLAKLQTAGMLRSNLNPLLQLSPALFVSALYLSLLPLYKVLIPNLDVYSSDELALAREFVIEFTVNGLLVIPVEAKPGKR
jgi:TetR/AcrR family transcriptional regulator